MQDTHAQSETKGKCCGKGGGNGAQRRGKHGSSGKHKACANIISSPLEILQTRFARGEIDAVEFEEKRRLVTSA